MPKTKFFTDLDTTGAQSHTADTTTSKSMTLRSNHLCGEDTSARQIQWTFNTAGSSTGKMPQTCIAATCMKYNQLHTDCTWFFINMVDGLQDVKMDRFACVCNINA